jgi:hypothetical protein
MTQNINAFIAKLLTGKIELLVIETKPARGAIANLRDQIPGIKSAVITSTTTPDELHSYLKHIADQTVVLDIDSVGIPVELQQAIANIYRTRQIPATFMPGPPEGGILRHAPLSAPIAFTGKLIIKTFNPLTEITCDMAGVEVVTW